MKTKKWIEVRPGHTVEVSAIRRFNLGKENKYLHIKYVGEKIPHSILMDNEKQSKEAYKKISEALK
jgi:hypothetical protein